MMCTLRSNENNYTSSDLIFHIQCTDKKSCQENLEQQERVNETTLLVYRPNMTEAFDRALAWCQTSDNKLHSDYQRIEVGRKLSRVLNVFFP